MPHIKFKDTPHKKYKCSIRLIRICSENRIRRVSDISKMTFNEFLSLPECGRATATQVEEILRDNGLEFREKIDKKRLRDPSQRNQLIAELVTEGQSYQEVGGRVGLSPSTVARIYKRHCSERTAEAITH
ncbi:MAG: hypothetical protein HKP41_13510 [Desulfobacterales bacterium]|nr:helix-turn-helix domain-containing protein [Desulfofustis sp.]NNK95363.1 hypothetical protein [Desulfobacterales bacterium]RZW25010.1 MAG: hypothetical protein EX260_03600 [Desulfobulbaceae bacterium]MBT8355657.1 helix-turn-helix domain-containing protein [Desulfofustis sp.]NNF47468.1 hypothetical protein [Desulfofustis sp.]